MFSPVTVTPKDPRYTDLVRGLNQRWIGRPQSVQLVGSTAQTVTVVQQAVREGKRLSVHGGGHCFEDFVYNADVQLVVDMSEMKQVYFDAARNAFAVEAGATLLEVYETLYRLWGVTIPAGVCYTVGVGGHISGGGWGMLCRQYGLSVDHLYAVEVVVVDAGGTARAVVATREKSDPNRDLWWAHTGGGGGNFGVVTRYWFRSPGARGTDPAALLPAPPRQVLVSAISWEWSELTRSGFTALVKNFGAWHVANSAPGNRSEGLCALLTLSHRSHGQISLVTQSDATVPDAERLHNDFLTAMRTGVNAPSGAVTSAFGEHGPMPEFAAVQRLPWLQATRKLGTTVGSSTNVNDPTIRADHKSAYMRQNFPDKHVAVLYKHLTSPVIDNPAAMAQLHSFGGMVNATRPTATASAHRDSAMKLIIYVQWSDQADDAGYISWLRDFYRELYADTGGVPVPNAVTDGCYVNYPDIDLSDPRQNRSAVPWYTLYYKENYPRLQQVKSAWDPRDTFRHGQSVQLPR
ncbi:FAD-linked oxidase [Kibdelosporangium phytohabitans]|uniref:FAD-linked oxidase n=3 Tax=Kibdelosporangium phytohabitans TaxID=860235 RepID=A0A0N9IEX7_9PSEU|nr:FAD-linked oxidase [Kibdelosporangium phytohabitans]